MAGGARRTAPTQRQSIMLIPTAILRQIFVCMSQCKQKNSLSCFFFFKKRPIVPQPAVTGRGVTVVRTVAFYQVSNSRQMSHCIFRIGDRILMEMVNRSINGLFARPPSHSQKSAAQPHHQPDEGPTACLERVMTWWGRIPS